MIIATAGHIDHGKTALVAALTGVDTDRLAEEKRRGMSIDLGFAYRPAGEGAILGFVDVPGHERFVRTMVAGVVGVDFVLLVVAADDGVMPQTREHAEIVDLVGISRGAVALTKIDRVDGARRAAVEAEIRQLLEATALDGAPVFALSSRTGEGVEALKDHLHGEACLGGGRQAAGHFRLAIDRVFTLSGVGIVVTGPVLSGEVAAGDRLVLSPRGVPVRARGLRAEDRETGRSGAGHRCAVNIAATGLDRNAIRRGDWLVAPEAHAPSAQFDAQVRVVGREGRVLAHWTPVHLHIGTDDVPARVAVLDRPSIAPGASGLARLVPDRPVGAMAGDRFVIRDQSARRTIAGGRVIDPHPPRRGRARPERLAMLRALETDDHSAALAGALELSPRGIDLAGFARSRNLDEARAGEVLAAAGAVIAGDFGIAPAHFARLKRDIVERLGAFHAAAPDRLGPDPGALARLVGGAIASELLGAAVSRLVDEGTVRLRGPLVHLARFAPSLAPRHANVWKRIEPVLKSAGLAPPVVHEIARAIGGDPGQVASALRGAEAMGLVTRVGRNRFALVETVARLAAIAEALAREGRLTPGDYRSRARIGRNFAVEMLEHFDRVGMTRREGDTRLLLKPAARGTDPRDWRAP
jgi:selenocysteine-specific elongation factor